MKSRQKLEEPTMEKGSGTLIFAYNGMLLINKEGKTFYHMINLRSTMLKDRSLQCTIPFIVSSTTGKIHLWQNTGCLLGQRWKQTIWGTRQRVRQEHMSWNFCKSYILTLSPYLSISYTNFPMIYLCLNWDQEAGDATMVIWR